MTKRDVRITKQRDVIIHLYQKETNLNSKELSDKVSKDYGVRMGREMIRKATTSALILKEKKSYSEQEEEE